MQVSRSLLARASYFITLPVSKTHACDLHIHPWITQDYKFTYIAWKLTNYYQKLDLVLWLNSDVSVLVCAIKQQIWGWSQERFRKQWEGQGLPWWELPLSVLAPPPPRAAFLPSWWSAGASARPAPDAPAAAGSYLPSAAEQHNTKHGKGSEPDRNTTYQLTEHYKGLPREALRKNSQITRERSICTGLCKVESVYRKAVVHFVSKLLSAYPSKKISIQL